MTVRERIFIFIKAEGKTKGFFERKVGVSKGYMDKLRISPSETVMEKIGEAFPHLNMIWLRSGAGSMYKEPTEASVVVGSNNVNSHVENVSDVNMDTLKFLQLQIQVLNDQLKAKDRQINELLKKLNS